MQVLFETIKIENHQIFNLSWHNRRVNKSRFELFGEKEPLDLRDYIDPPCNNRLYRCRILYDTQVHSVEYIPYQPKKINQLKIVQSNLEYHYKYNDRSALNTLLQEEYDEIIIEKENLLTDTSIANIAFYDGNSWITPKQPLLEGTTRARLLNRGFLVTKDIKKEDIKNYSHFALMNAMIGFQIQNSMNIQL